uniref:Uncharacterized protein n=1 Tax=Neobodo designis TaxID=312471 RepID=A0A7S1M8E9_NEODS
MAALSQLYCDECVIHGCLTNSAMLSLFKDLDSGDKPLPNAIDLRGNYLGDKNVAAVCTVLSTLPGVESLDLRGLDLQLDGVTAVCRLAASHRGVRRIDFRNNELFASSGRQLLELLKQNRRITQCLFDTHTMPHRFVNAIHAQLGRNIAAAHPCTWESCEEDAARVEILEPIVTRRVGDLTDFQTQVQNEARQHAPELLRLFEQCGVVACQVFVDFGAPGLQHLTAVQARFANASRDFCLGTTPRFERVRAVLKEEFTHYAASATVQEAVEGTLLESQIASAVALADAVCSDQHIDDAVAMACHIRNALRNLRSHSLTQVEDAASALRVQLTAAIERTRKLQVVRHETRYLRMDHPQMAHEAGSVYQCCQSPLRRSFEELEGQLTRLARPPYAAERRRLVSEFAAVVPAALTQSLFEHWVAKALDNSVSTEGLHIGTNPHIAACQDWTDVVDTHLADAAAASTLVESVAGCDRLGQYRVN